MINFGNKQQIINDYQLSATCQNKSVTQKFCKQKMKLEFYGPVNTNKIMSSWSVYLTTILLASLAL